MNTSSTHAKAGHGSPDKADSTIHGGLILLLLLLLLCPVRESVALDARSPFGVGVHPGKQASPATLEVFFTVPQDCHLYQERLHFINDAGDEIVPTAIPEAVAEMDKASGKEMKVYLHDFTVVLPAAAFSNAPVAVKFQGCTNAECYFPEKRVFAFNASGQFEEIIEKDGETPDATPGVADWTGQLHGYKVAARQSGYMGQKNFLSFLDRSVSGNDQADDPMGKLAKLGPLLKFLSILFGGFLLNLTPCILPMIPINLAIIGAGSAASSRLAGLRNGSVYGLGMAIAYGVLGLAVVLTGSKFGTLNSSMWFNVAIAAVFGLLSLGMFGVVNIDLSRFGGNVGPKGKAKGTFVQSILIFVMGVIAALLAGACVAPVVIAVVLYSTNEYASGHYAGLLLPFLLGAGMALPWPFAGAGLSFLPKPGRWMNRVKHGFGVLILLFGLYYIHLGVEAWRAGRDATLLADAPAGTQAAARSNPDRDLADALQKARDQGKPVLIDFHASWCKNCAAMDETVFNRQDVQQRLQDFVLVRYDAESPGQMPAKGVLDHFNIMGLPAYVVLTQSK